ncbi:phosphoenolpyruvate phosphomutase-domain-containing protein [Aspergillus nidulans var. acristatus]
MSIRTEQNNQAIYFRNLHNPKNPLILTNVYDAATASLIANHPSTKAIATGSYAIAASQGIADDALSFPKNLAAIRSIASVLKRNEVLSHQDETDISLRFPLTVDIQDGYNDVDLTVKEIIKLGVVGCNIEDLDSNTGQLRPVSDAVHRIKVALQAAKESGVPDFVVNARTDVLGSLDKGTIEDAIERGRAYLDAGACTVFVWGGAGGRGVSRDEVERLAKAFEGRLNVKLVLREGFLTVSELRKLGLARISLGPELYRAAMDAFQEKADAVLRDCL